jgi:uncharacterized protein (TIGR02271 family)
MSSELGKLGRQSEVILPLYAEELSVSKRRVVTGRTQISTVTRNQEEQVQEELVREQVEIERRPVGKPVNDVPSIRREGDTIVIPVVEEQVVVERRLILKEEVRITRIRKLEVHRERVVTRKQELKLARVPAQERQEP